MSRPPRSFGLIDTILIIVLAVIIIALFWHWRQGLQIPVPSWIPS
jgi:hypothetical protein